MHKLDTSAHQSHKHIFTIILPIIEFPGNTNCLIVFIGGGLKIIQYVFVRLIIEIPIQCKLYLYKY